MEADLVALRLILPIPSPPGVDLRRAGCACGPIGSSLPCHGVEPSGKRILVDQLSAKRPQVILAHAAPIQSRRALLRMNWTVQIASSMARC